MPIDPISVLMAGEINLISHLKFKDFWLVHKFNRDAKKRHTYTNFFGDLWEIKTHIISAITNSDEKDKNAWIGLLLSKLDQIDDVERYGLSFVVEEIIINYSKLPNFVESDIFTLYAWFCKYYNDWEIKYPEISHENDLVVSKEIVKIKYFLKGWIENSNVSPAFKKGFNDQSFLSALTCAQILHRSCLNAAELSGENLIRVGNHLTHFSAGEPGSGFRKNVIFDIIYLEIIIQIAAKAKSLQIEPIYTKLKNIVLQTNPIRLNEALKTLDGTYENNFAKLGKIDVFLATPAEIQYFKDGLNEIISPPK